MRGTGSSETDYLNGEAVLLGRLYGVATPMNEVMALYVDRMVREKQAPAASPSKNCGTRSPRGLRC